MKKLPTLNIPSDIDQFENVSFVLGMKEYSLRVFIKRMWDNFMALANAMDKRHKDVSVVIDKILSKHSWSITDLKDRLRYAVIDTNDLLKLKRIDDVSVVQIDTLDETITFLDEDNNIIVEPIKLVTMAEIKK